MANCTTFLNRPVTSYIPLSCRPLVVNTRVIGGTGLENKQNFFFLTKPNTIRENATLDVIFPHPSWLVDEINSSLPKLTDTRITEAGDTRIIDSGLIRVIE